MRPENGGSLLASDFLRCRRRDEILDRNRKAARTNAGRMPDRVRNGAGLAGDADLADTLDAERIHMRVVLLDHQRLHRRHVGIHGQCSDAQSPI